MVQADIRSTGITMTRCGLVLGTLLLLMATFARADWHEASSDHFVIYSDHDPAAITAFSERLELFHAAMAHVFKRQEGKPSPSNRMTIIVLTNAA
jgi:hypothetical protein